jgi:hypothetical protein
MAPTVDDTKFRSLLERGRETLAIGQRDLAVVIGSSYRSVQRMQAGQSWPTPEQMQRLAVAVHKEAPPLAAEIAAAAGATLETLGVIEPPRVPQGPPPPPADLVPLLAEAVVAAAAEVLDLSPATVRPALLAALERAQKARLTLDALASALEDATASHRGRKTGRPSLAQTPTARPGSHRPVRDQPA